MPRRALEQILERHGSDVYGGIEARLLGNGRGTVPYKTHIFFWGSDAPFAPGGGGKIVRADFFLGNRKCCDGHDGVERCPPNADVSSPSLMTVPPTVWGL